MSLYDSEYHDPPDYNAYVHRDLIPKSERCQSCEGFGTQRERFSMTGKDWRACWYCDGTGRKAKEPR